jgi:hypothetical protein
MDARQLIVYEENDGWYADSAEYGTFKLPKYVRSLQDVCEWHLKSRFKIKRLIFVEYSTKRKRYRIYTKKMKYIDSERSLKLAKKRVRRQESIDRSNDCYTFGEYVIYDSVRAVDIKP